MRAYTQGKSHARPSALAASKVKEREFLRPASSFFSGRAPPSLRRSSFSALPVLSSVSTQGHTTLSTVVALRTLIGAHKCKVDVRRQTYVVRKLLILFWLYGNIVVAFAVRIPNHKYAQGEPHGLQFSRVDGRRVTPIRNTFPPAAHQTGRAELPHPAFRQDHVFAHGRPLVVGSRHIKPYFLYSSSCGKRAHPPD